MKKIAIVHKGKAHIPETTVYQDLLSKYGFQVDYCPSEDELFAQDYDVEWHFMGIDINPFSLHNRFVIHEYLSLSIPPFAILKNRIKRRFNRRPDIRVFNGEMIESEFHFQDGIKHFIRQPGIGDHFFTPVIITKRYDFVYLGAMDNSRNTPVFFDRICRALSENSILAIGNPPSVRNLSTRYPNMHFVGQVPHNEVPILLKSAEYGLNLMPNLYPYHIQPSYKLIEYCAAGLKVITTDYLWANQFEKQHHGRFYKLDHKFENLSMKALSGFAFVTPDVSHFTWEQSFRQSGLLDLLLAI